MMSYIVSQAMRAAQALNVPIRESMYFLILSSAFDILETITCQAVKSARGCRPPESCLKGMSIHGLAFASQIGNFLGVTALDKLTQFPIAARTTAIATQRH